MFKLLLALKTLILTDIGQILRSWFFSLSLCSCPEHLHSLKMKNFPEYFCVLFQPLKLCVLCVHNDDRRFFCALELTKQRSIGSENEVCSMLCMSYNIFVRTAKQIRSYTTYTECHCKVVFPDLPFA